MKARSTKGAVRPPRLTAWRVAQQTVGRRERET
jgi:hypothetical protein